MKARKPTGLIKRSVRLSGHATSVALEPAFWDTLERAADAKALSLSALVAEIDAGRGPTQPLTQALRLAALDWALSRTRD